MAIWAAALFAFLAFVPNRNPNADRWDSGRLHELGYAVDVWARWDSDWYIRIAQDGYGQASAAFFPLYPALVGLLGRVLFGHYVLAGVLISLACAFAALALLYRLAEERLGADGACRCVLYLAIFPTTLFLQAVYAESLFLLLAVGAFLLAERGRFSAAGAVAGLALLTRPFGIALLPPLALMAWRARDRRRALTGLALAPALAALYPLLLWWQVGDPFAFTDAQDRWNRNLSAAGPLGGIWAGARDALTGAAPSGTSAQHALAVNVEGLLYLVLFGVLAAIAWRRFGAPYGLFAALGLALPLSVPSERWPLLSISRFGLVLFPLFLALATLGRSPRVHAAIVGISGILLGVNVVRWSLWQWVA